MKLLSQIFLVTTLFMILNGCNAQTPESTNSTKNTKLVGGAFENNEFTFVGIPEEINSVDTSAGWNQEGQKILVTGVIYQLDGKTPASDVLLYYYHTNTDGRYLYIPEEKRSMPPNSKGQTHGYIRGWVKSDTNGRYSIYTVRPGSYPAYDEPAHIHITVKEPNELNEYYIDDFLFDDDKFITAAKRNKLENRCGSGILQMLPKGNLLVGERNIVLGLNIPDYPMKVK